MSTDESSSRPSEPEVVFVPPGDRKGEAGRVARGAAEAVDPQRSLRRLPKVDEELRRPELQAADVPRWALLAAVRESIEAMRQELRRGAIPDGGREDPGEPGLRLIPAQVLAAARRMARPPLRRVINATGVILHTNLGRAPLPARSLQRITEAAEGYCNLEYQLATGQRGSRQDLLPELLRPITGAEAHLVVNNNAAAVLLMLAGLCVGRKVVVSRGELVEIGGSFRVPDVMRASGAILCEVGTTNRTHRRDYEAAAEDAAAFLKVHRGNFAIVGFVAEVGAAELAAMAHERGLLCLYDLGSGALLLPEGAAANGGGQSATDEGEAAAAAAEPTVPQAVAAGCDVVSFSCDKLLGGPQAGVLCGAAAAVRPLHKHPLMRALRPDKLTLAALLGALELYRDGRADEIPVLRMLCESATALRARAERLLDRLRALGIEADVVAVRSAVGGGAMPLWQPQSYAVALRSGDAQARLVEAALRRGDPEVIARIESGRLLFDVRTIAEAELAPLAAALRCAVAPR